MSSVQHPHVFVRDVDGIAVAFVADTNIPVRRMWSWYKRGTSVETLIKRYPMLGPAKVLSALAFAYDNEERMRTEIEQIEAREEALADGQSSLAYKGLGHRR